MSAATFWGWWCVACGIWMAACVVFCLAVAAWSSLPKIPRRKRTAKRACATCEHEHASAVGVPCAGCLSGDSMWTPKR